MVLKLVSMPPSQRWLTKGISQRRASFSTASRAERLVPTNSTLPPSATMPRTNPAASAYMGCVFSRLMMWILFRSPKMKGAIFGFQKRVWCPKWTPASSICRIDTPDINTPVWVEPPRIPDGNPEELEIEGLGLQFEDSPGHPAVCDDTRAGLLKIAALYTMN